jgi:Dolichyl-phosphate-mannose-protein mannosyltransferase
MDITSAGIRRIPHSSILILVLPLLLSAFAHIWNPIGFPDGPSNDEGIYLRRAMNVLVGQGPQESRLYDHPYFAQLFLAGILQISDYPKSLNPFVGNQHSIEMLYFIPRIVIGIFAVIDTFLIYKLSEYRYNRTVALIASSLFAVMPLSSIIRRVWLEPIQLPFLLSSILFAICTKNTNNKDKRILLVLLSGIFLGLGIFTKVTIFTMIPLLLVLLITSNVNNKNLKSLGLWFIPVISIPLIWPAYAIFINEFDLWLHGVYFQIHRGAQTFLEAIKYNFSYDFLFMFIGIMGLVFAAVRRDILLLLWGIPFLIFIYIQGFVSYWHFIPLFPMFSIASATMVEYGFRKIINKKTSIIKQLSYSLLFCIFFGASLFGIVSITLAIIENDNSVHFTAAKFLSQYLADNNNDTSVSKQNKIFLISNPFYSWIPKYVFKLNNYQIVDYYDDIPVKADRVILVVDPEWKYRLDNHMVSKNMEDNFKLYAKNTLATLGDIYYNVTIYGYNLEEYSKGKARLPSTPFELIHDDRNKQFFKYDNVTSPNR